MEMKRTSLKTGKDLMPNEKASSEIAVKIEDKGKKSEKDRRSREALEDEVSSKYIKPNNRTLG